jgi:hypothetical protein
MIQPLRQSTWAIPAFLFIATVAGLILALTAEGYWDWLAWVLVVLPVGVVAVLSVRSRFL